MKKVMIKIVGEVEDDVDLDEVVDSLYDCVLGTVDIGDIDIQEV